MNNHTNINKNLSSSIGNNPYYNWKEAQGLDEGIRPCCFINIDINNCFPCCHQETPPVPSPPDEPNQPLPSSKKSKGDVGKFEALPQKLNNGQPYEFKNVDTKGSKIIYDPEIKAVVLKSNTVFRYSYMTETILDGKISSNLENILVLNADDISISGSKDSNVKPGVLTPLQSEGQFSTKEGENLLWLIYSTDPEVQGLTSATLTITEVTK